MSDSGCLLRCVFHKGPYVLTCAVERTSQHAFDVCVLPHWNLSDATVERFDAPAGAVRRQAQIALNLRQAGWVARYGTSRPTGVVAA